MPNASHPDAPAAWNDAADISISAVKPGDRLICDDGFVTGEDDENGSDIHCILPWSILTVSMDPDSDHNLFVPCTHGKHFLDGQLRDDDTLIGMRLIKPGAEKCPTTTTDGETSAASAKPSGSDRAG